MDCRVKCLARGHDRHLFGDITDTLVVGQVDICDLIGAEEDAELTLGCERSDREPRLDCFAPLAMTVHHAYVLRSQWRRPIGT
jgi:hypothetical protein